MQSACLQLWLSGSYCSKRKRSTICGQLGEKTASERTNTPGSYNTANCTSFCISICWSIIYTECNKQCTDKSCSDLVCVYASAPQFLAYLPMRLNQGITLIFNPPNLILLTCNLSFFSAEKCYIHTQQSW